MSTTSQPASKRGQSLTTLADKGVLGIARHWLALASLFWGLYVGLPLLAPILMTAGWEVPAKVIYFVYRPACHQRPERSYFIGGPKAVYSVDELTDAGLDLRPLARDIGNESVGWKMAFCERDTAIYGAIFFTGLVYGIVRRRWSGWLMPFRYYLVFLVPMGIDGVLQLFGIHESSWVLRTVTGAFFGGGSVLFAYPYLDQGFAEVRESTAKRLSEE